MDLRLPTVRSARTRRSPQDNLSSLRYPTTSRSPSTGRVRNRKSPGAKPSRGSDGSRTNGLSPEQWRRQKIDMLRTAYAVNGKSKADVYYPAARNFRLDRSLPHEQPRYPRVRGSPNPPPSNDVRALNAMGGVSHSSKSPLDNQAPRSRSRGNVLVKSTPSSGALLPRYTESRSRPPPPVGRGKVSIGRKPQLQVDPTAGPVAKKRSPLLSPMLRDAIIQPNNNAAFNYNSSGSTVVDTSGTQDLFQASRGVSGSTYSSASASADGDRVFTRRLPPGKQPSVSNGPSLSQTVQDAAPRRNHFYRPRSSTSPRKKTSSMPQPHTSHGYRRNAVGMRSQQAAPSAGWSLRQREALLVPSVHGRQQPRVTHTLRDRKPRPPHDSPLTKRRYPKVSLPDKDLQALSVSSPIPPSASTTAPLPTHQPRLPSIGTVHSVLQQQFAEEKRQKEAMREERLRVQQIQQDTAKRMAESYQSVTSPVTPDGRSLPFAPDIPADEHTVSAPLFSLPVSKPKAEPAPNRIHVRIPQGPEVVNDEASAGEEDRQLVSPGKSRGPVPMLPDGHLERTRDLNGLADNEIMPELDKNTIILMSPRHQKRDVHGDGAKRRRGSIDVAPRRADKHTDAIVQTLEPELSPIPPADLNESIELSADEEDGGDAVNESIMLTPEEERKVDGSSVTSHEQPEQKVDFALLSPRTYGESLLFNVRSQPPSPLQPRSRIQPEVLTFDSPSRTPEVDESIRLDSVSHPGSQVAGVFHDTYITSPLGSPSPGIEDMRSDNTSDSSNDDVTPIVDYLSTGTGAVFFRSHGDRTDTTSGTASSHAVDVHADQVRHLMMKCGFGDAASCLLCLQKLERALRSVPPDTVREHFAWVSQKQRHLQDPSPDDHVFCRDLKDLERMLRMQITHDTSISRQLPIMPRICETVLRWDNGKDEEKSGGHAMPSIGRTRVYLLPGLTEECAQRWEAAIGSRSQAATPVSRKSPAVLDQKEGPEDGWKATQHTLDMLDHLLNHRGAAHPAEKRLDIKHLAHFELVAATDAPSDQIAVSSLDELMAVVSKIESETLSRDFLQSVYPPDGLQAVFDTLTDPEARVFADQRGVTVDRVDDEQTTDPQHADGESPGDVAISLQDLMSMLTVCQTELQRGGPKVTPAYQFSDDRDPHSQTCDLLVASLRRIDGVASTEDLLPKLVQTARQVMEDDTTSTAPDTPTDLDQSIALDGDSTWASPRAGSSVVATLSGNSSPTPEDRGPVLFELGIPPAAPRSNGSEVTPDPVHGGDHESQSTVANHVDEAQPAGEDVKSSEPEVQFGLSMSNFPKLDKYSDSDPQIVATIDETEVGRTEFLTDDSNPVFQKGIGCDASEKEGAMVRLTVGEMNQDGLSSVGEVCVPLSVVQNASAPLVFQIPKADGSGWVVGEDGKPALLCVNPGDLRGVAVPQSAAVQEPVNAPTEEIPETKALPVQSGGEKESQSTVANHVDEAQPAGEDVKSSEPEVQFGLSMSNFPKLDKYSDSDPQIVATIDETEVGRTEFLTDDNNPVFQKGIEFNPRESRVDERADGDTEEERMVRLLVGDVKRDGLNAIGEVYVPLLQLQECTKPLVFRVSKRDGSGWLCGDDGEPTLLCVNPGQKAGVQVPKDFMPENVPLRDQQGLPKLSVRTQSMDSDGSSVVRMPAPGSVSGYRSSSVSQSYTASPGGSVPSFDGGIVVAELGGNGGTDKSNDPTAADTTNDSANGASGIPPANGTDTVDANPQAGGDEDTGPKAAAVARFLEMGGKNRPLPDRPQTQGGKRHGCKDRKTKSTVPFVVDANYSVNIPRANNADQDQGAPEAGQISPPNHTVSEHSGAGLYPHHHANSFSFESAAFGKDVIAKINRDDSGNVDDEVVSRVRAAINDAADPVSVSRSRRRRRGHNRSTSGQIVDVGALIDRGHEAKSQTDGGVPPPTDEEGGSGLKTHLEDPVARSSGGSGALASPLLDDGRRRLSAQRNEQIYDLVRSAVKGKNPADSTTSEPDASGPANPELIDGPSDQRTSEREIDFMSSLEARKTGRPEEGGADSVLSPIAKLGESPPQFYLSPDVGTSDDQSGGVNQTPEGQSSGEAGRAVVESSSHAAKIEQPAVVVNANSNTSGAHISDSDHSMDDRSASERSETGGGRHALSPGDAMRDDSNALDSTLSHDVSIGLDTTLHESQEQDASFASPTGQLDTTQEAKEREAKVIEAFAGMVKNPNPEQDIVWEGALKMPARTYLYLELSVDKIKSRRGLFFGGSTSPYLVVRRCHRTLRSSQMRAQVGSVYFWNDPLYKSAVHKGNKTPRFAPALMNAWGVCYYEFNRPILIQVWDRHMDKKDELLGECVTKLEQLVALAEHSCLPFDKYHKSNKNLARVPLFLGKSMNSRKESGGDGAEGGTGTGKQTGFLRVNSLKMYQLNRVEDRVVNHDCDCGVCRAPFVVGCEKKKRKKKDRITLGGAPRMVRLDCACTDLDNVHTLGTTTARITFYFLVPGSMDDTNRWPAPEGFDLRSKAPCEEFKGVEGSWLPVFQTETAEPSLSPRFRSLVTCFQSFARSNAHWPLLAVCRSEDYLVGLTMFTLNELVALHHMYRDLPQDVQTTQARPSGMEPLMGWTSAATGDVVVMPAEEMAFMRGRSMDNTHPALRAFRQTYMHRVNTALDDHLEHSELSQSRRRRSRSRSRSRRRSGSRSRSRSKKEDLLPIDLRYVAKQQRRASRRASRRATMKRRGSVQGNAREGALSMLGDSLHDVGMLTRRGSAGGLAIQTRPVQAKVKGPKQYTLPSRAFPLINPTRMQEERRYVHSGLLHVLCFRFLRELGVSEIIAKDEAMFRNAAAKDFGQSPTNKPRSLADATANSGQGEEGFDVPSRRGSVSLQSLVHWQRHKQAHGIHDDSQANNSAHGSLVGVPGLKEHEHSQSSNAEEVQGDPLRRGSLGERKSPDSGNRRSSLPEVTSPNGTVRRFQPPDDHVLLNRVRDHLEEDEALMQISGLVGDDDHHDDQDDHDEDSRRSTRMRRRRRHDSTEPSHSGRSRSSRRATKKKKKRKKGQSKKSRRSQRGIDVQALNLRNKMRRQRMVEETGEVLTKDIDVTRGVSASMYFQGGGGSRRGSLAPNSRRGSLAPNSRRGSLAPLSRRGSVRGDFL